MATQARPTTADAEIRNLIESWLEAVRAKDLDAIMGHYAPDILSFDAIAQLQFKGAQAYRKHWQACFEMCPGETVFEAHELGIAAAGDVAFCHYLCRCGGTGPDGKMQVGWMRATVCCRRTNGRWLVAHEHFSAPFDPQSSKALFDLEP